MARCGRIQREPEFAASVDCGWVFWVVNMLLVKPLKWIFFTLLGSSTFIVLELVKIAKFCQPGRKHASAHHDVYIGIYQLLRFKKQLRDSVRRLNLEAERCKEETRVLLQKRKRSQALRCWRRCKWLKKRADSLFVKLKIIHGILDRIAQSQTDMMVLQAYQAGMTALRHSLKDLTVEHKSLVTEYAESLVDQIQELCDTQDEVNQIISRGVTAADEDMDELEEELTALLDESILD